LTFRTQMGGQICPLNLKFNSQVELKNIGVDVGVTGVGIQEPRYETYGIIFPGLNNDIQTMVQNIRVMGFDTGMSLGECASYDQITSGSCKTGFRLEPMWHGFHVNYGYAINCATGVVAVPNTAVGSPPGMYVQWTTLETEDNSSGGWDDLYYDVYDPGSIMYGDIHLSTSGLGSARVPKCYGATNVTLHIPGQGVYNNYYSFGRLDTTNNISLYLGSTRAGANPESDSATYANATLTVGRDNGNTLLNAKSGQIIFYRAQSTVLGSVTTNGFVGNGVGLTNISGTNIIGSGNAAEYLKGDGTWGTPSATATYNALDDVATNTLADGDIMIWDDGNAVWTNYTPTFDISLDAYNIWTGSNTWQGSNTFETPLVFEGGFTNSNGYMWNFDGSIGVRGIQFGDAPGSTGWSASQYISNNGAMAMGGGAFVVDSGGNTFAASYSGGSESSPGNAQFPNGVNFTTLSLGSNAQFSVAAPNIGLWNSNGQSLWIITATRTNFLGGTAP
jgi:hypothetical protein